MSKPLTIPAASKESGVPYQTLLRLVNQKLVRSIEIPGRRSRLVHLEDVQAAIESMKVGGKVGSVSVSIEPETVGENPIKPAQTNQSQNMFKPGDITWYQRYAAK